MSTAKRVKALPGDARFRWELCIYKVLGIVQNSVHGQSLHFCCVLIFCLAPVLGWGWRFTLSSKTKKQPFFFFFFSRTLPLVSLCCPVSFTCHRLRIQRSLNVTGDVGSCFAICRDFPGWMLGLSLGLWECGCLPEARFPASPWRGTWQRKAIRQASKDTQRLPASPPPHHPFSSPHLLIALPLLLRFIHTSDGRDGGTPAGRREGVAFASHSLEGLWDCLHLDWVSAARGLFSPDGLSTVPTSLWFSSPAPAAGLEPRCVPSVPGGIPGWSSPSLGNLPAGAPLIRAYIPGVATGRPAAARSRPWGPAHGQQRTPSLHGDAIISSWSG